MTDCFQGKVITGRGRDDFGVDPNSGGKVTNLQRSQAEIKAKVSSTVALLLQVYNNVFGNVSLPSHCFFP